MKMVIVFFGNIYGDGGGFCRNNIEDYGYLVSLTEYIGLKAYK